MTKLMEVSNDQPEKARTKWRGTRHTKKYLAEIGECQLALYKAMMKNEAEAPLLDPQPYMQQKPQPPISIQSVFEEPMP